MNPKLTAGWTVELAFEAYCLNDAPTLEVARRLSGYGDTVSVDALPYAETVQVVTRCAVCARPLHEVAQERATQLARLN